MKLLKAFGEPEITDVAHGLYILLTISLQK